jgi:hypothetical protein
VVSRADKLLEYRFQGSLANFLSPTSWVGLFSACVSPVPVAGGVTQKRYGSRARSRNVLRSCRRRRSDRNGGAPLKVLIGVDPHKTSVAAVEKAKGELIERASFPQDRAGLCSLERWAKRLPERRLSDGECPWSR